jgi:phosphate transport system substrate-binding protein
MENQTGGDMSVAPRTTVMNLLLGILLAFQWGPAQAQVRTELDPALKHYEKNGSHRVEGTVVAGASESIRRLFDLWTERFHQHHRSVKFETTGILTADAAEAIFKGTAPIKEGADLVAISFPLSQTDLEAIKSQRGAIPVHVAVAMDAIVLVVHHKNPVQGLTVDQLAQIFGTPSNQSADIELWKQVGVDGKFSGLEINRYGRVNTSGTYMAFKAMALQGTEQRTDVHKEPGSMSVILEVGTDERGIGYAATGYAARTNKVRVVPLARKSDAPYILPNNDTVLTGEYPLVRELHVYAMPGPDGKLKSTSKHFLEFILSRDGQELAKEEGFFPLPAKMTEQALKRLEGNGHEGPAVAEQK